MDLSAFAARARRALALATLPLCLTLAGSASAQVTFGGGASTSGGAQGGAAATAPAAPAAAAPAAAAPAAAAPEAPASNEDEWAQRDRALGEASALSGGTGLLHTQHAQSGAPGQFRLAFTAEYFSAGFLCSSQFPCKNPTGAGTVTSDSLDHIGGTISLSATITKWLEGYVATSAIANSDSTNRPPLLQVLGDTDFGLKGFVGLGKIFWVGGGAELWLINGTGSVGLDGSGTGAKFRALGTADLRGMDSKIPLRFSLNPTYSLDNTSDVVSSTEAPVAAGGRGSHITRIERFGLGINRVDHFDINFGGEFFALQERI